MKELHFKNNSNSHSKMKLSSLFVIATILVLGFGSLLGLSIYYNVKLQELHELRLEVNNLRLLWDKHENMTKELFITYNLAESSQKWKTTLLQFDKKFSNFIASPFSKRLAEKNLDFNIKVKMILMHYAVVKQRHENAYGQLKNYENAAYANRDSGNILVNFGENWSTGQYSKTLIELLGDLRWASSLSDYTFAKAMDDVNLSVAASIHEKTTKLRWISLALAFLIFSALVIFVLSYIREIVHDREKTRKHAAELTKTLREQQRTEDLLRSERDKFQGVLSAIGEKIYIVNKNYEIDYQNEILDMLHGNRVGEKCFRTYLQSDTPCSFCSSEKVTSLESIDNTESLINDRNYELVFAPFKDIEGDFKTIVLWRDVTEKRRYEADAARAGCLASIGELAAGVAHEINNPISGIISIAEVLRDENTENKNYCKLYNQIIKESDRVAIIVRKLLEFSRDRNEDSMPFYLKDILDDSLSLMGSQILKNGTKLVLDFPPDLPAIEVQNHEIQQVFINILNNAMYALKQKFTGKDPENTLIISGRVESIDDKQYIRTTFYDGGIGIPRNIIDKICTPFFSSKPKGKGTGLGLSISYNIVQSHGGKLTFESVANRYTKVFVDLPVK
jgi:C4-dicarboxylate-specific signal transduction histidine kinase